MTNFAAKITDFDGLRPLNNTIMTKYGLLGHPLGHSFSRKFHNDRFQRLEIEAVYENFDLEDISLLPGVLDANPDLRGLNVTIPYKQAVMQYLDELDPLATRIGAVNTIRVTPAAEGEETKIKGWHLAGFNTDIVGFRDSLIPMLSGKERGAFVLGTGGASKAVTVALQDLGIEPVYVSRTAAPGRLTYQDLTPEVMAAHQVIVNCTPLGMFPKVEACPDIPYELLTHDHVCFDCVYNPAETLFMKKASAMGARVKCGQEMLEGQALAAYAIWTQGSESA